MSPRSRAKRKMPMVPVIGSPLADRAGARSPIVQQEDVSLAFGHEDE
jgi:hypothetical protein